MGVDARVFEMRTYVAAPGKLDALVTRFRDHTRALFERHGIANIGYWVALDPEGQPDGNLVYLVAHESLAAAERSWAAFATDPDWIAVRVASENGGGRLAASFTSVFLRATDFSPLQ